MGLNLYDPNLAINKALDIVWGEDGFMIFEDLGTKLEKRTLKSKFFLSFLILFTQCFILTYLTWLEWGWGAIFQENIHPFQC